MLLKHIRLSLSYWNTPTSENAKILHSILQEMLIWSCSSVQQPLSLVGWVAFQPWKWRGWASPKMAFSYRDGNGKHHQAHWDSVTSWNSNGTRFRDTVNWTGFFTSIEWEFKKWSEERKNRQRWCLLKMSFSIPYLQCLGTISHRGWKASLLSPS